METNPVVKLSDGKKSTKEQLIHDALANPQFLVLSGDGPTVTDSQGVPWTGNYVNANGDLTVDLQSDIAAESRAKIVYEYLSRVQLRRATTSRVQVSLAPVLSNAYYFDAFALR